MGLTWLETLKTSFLASRSILFFYRCDHHKILDVSFYDDKHLSVLLVEDTEDRTPVLVQMTFTLLDSSSYIKMAATVGVNISTDM